VTPLRGERRGAERRGRASDDDAPADQLEGRWFTKPRYRRRARITSITALTATGTVRLGFEVVDGAPFDYVPGQFVGIEHHFEGFGYRRSPYCILSSPTGDPVFDLLVRVVAAGPLSVYLAQDARVGDEIAFRGPTGRSMLPREDEEDLELVLFATGTGVSPFLSLVRHLVRQGSSQPMRLWWGLRLEDDICLTDELDELRAAAPNFDYAISLSQPSPAWTGLRGRITESVPPLLPALGGRRYYFTGNGAMIAELALALSDVGVNERLFHKEPFFDASHDPDPAAVAGIRGRFLAPDARSDYARAGTGGFDPNRILAAGRGDRAENLSVSDLFESLPGFLDHREGRKDDPDPNR
jgi:ferredoxin-NADP reductase